MAASPNGEMMSAPVILSAGLLELELNPPIGGSIARFDFRNGGQRVPILRGTDSSGGDILSAASFPLVPFVNRIRDGRFHFAGRTIFLQPNMVGDPSPLHGQGWLGVWEVTSVSGQEAELQFHHPAGEWPWAYQARQYFRLDEAGLTIELSCRNLSAKSMPCGLGQHPYFHCTSETRLQTEVEHVWTIDDKVLPVERIAATGQFDLSDRLVCGLGLDNGFDGWSGAAHVSDPEWPFTVTMTSPGTRFFQLYSPLAGNIFVIEPVTHANAALNAPEEQWPELGIRILGQGEEMSMTTRFEVV